MLRRGPKDKVAYCTPVELARAVGVCAETVRRWIANGLLPTAPISLRHYTDDRPRTGYRPRLYLPVDAIAKALALRSGGAAGRAAAASIVQAGERRRLRTAPPQGGGGSEGEGV